MLKPFGVQIVEGPQHWAVVQQHRGYGDIYLKGISSTKLEITADHALVYARVVSEDGSGAVLPWTLCLMGDGLEWSVTLQAIPAGGLYRIETCLRLDDDQPMELATRGDMIHHVAVGDIWVIAGQSNAAGYGRGPVNDPPEMGIHLLRHSGKWDLATHPFNESTNTVQGLNGEPVNPGHSPYLAFARLIKKETGMPIGFLQTALGGSPLERWDPDQDGDLYRNMMNVIESAGEKVRGILWYQGCSDCDSENAPTYLERFTRVVNHWREDLGDDALPILTVQLNRYAEYSGGEEGNRCWGIVRNAQRLAAKQLEQLYVVPALDCPLSDIIHNSPAGNLIIGERLARTALANLYGKEMPHQAPDITNASISTVTSDGRATLLLEFSNVAGELFAMGPGEIVFSIDDDLGLMPITSWTTRTGGRVELELPRPIEGTAVVHGAFEANPAAALPIDTGTYLPMLSFYNFTIQ
ncbi:sialate O-acetylesterase [Cohnella abietis]|uniref:Sialate O-acetylesterase domain-containing protein n=1 Tax=Cohnella abietis TaxID=2507935 RepID=A0A3T1D433_9BACL|nr:sialate O-acetylesterase [Cohnella abietis]BBI32870.1 hypothetical protein KCTCHS21_22690 [Cohnella abietis]